MRVLLILIFGLLSSIGTAQQVNISYRTVADSTEKFHFLVFTDKSNGKLIYPTRNHADVMFPQKREFSFAYSVIKDTIYIKMVESDLNNKTIERLKKSKFKPDGDGQLFDIVSGYTYVDNNLVSDRYDIYSVNGKIYRQKRPRTDGYGLVRKDYRPNQKLKKRIKKINADNYKITILRGKAAYNKYGLIGMNGVIEVTERNTIHNKHFHP